MPWSATHSIPALSHKTEEVKKLFAEVANDALGKGKSEKDAIAAGLAAVRNHEIKNKVKKSLEEPKVPAHVKAVMEVAKASEQKEEPRIRQAFLGKNALTPDSSRSLVSASWDDFGRLILQFDDGQKITTSKIPIVEKLEQTVNVAVNPVFDYLQFNIDDNTPHEELLPGSLHWNKFEDCLDILHEDGSILQTGLENYIRVKNDLGYTLTNGTVVMFNGVNLDENPEVIPIAALPAIDPLYLIGVLTNDIPDGTTGRATVLGKVRDLNTTGSDVGETWLQGDLLWVHPTSVGKLTRVRPSAPNPAISVAVVLKVGTTDGMILVKPTIFPRLFYGKFSSYLTQTPTLANTPYPVSFENKEFESGVRLIDSTKMVCDHAGLYSFDFRLQLAATNSSNKNVYIWIRRNGVDIPNTTSVVTVSGNSNHVASWNFVQPMVIGDYMELMYAASDTSVSINSPAPTAFCPAAPSAVIKVNQFNL